MAARKVLFAPAFGPLIGGGHAFRGFTLAQALMGRGVSCGMILSEAAASTLAAFIPEGLERLDGDRLAAAEAFNPDLIVIDDYGCDAEAEGFLAVEGFRLAVIDDLADRRHLAELLIDPSFGRAADDYDKLLPAGATVLAGPDYALLRPEFAKARSAALTRRKGPFGHRALVSLGLTDVGAVTRRVVGLLAGLIPTDVVLGSTAPSLPAVSRMAGVSLHVDARDMAALIAQADIGIGGGGVSVWERACLGLPSILVVLADNQAPMAAKLAEAGVVIALDARDDGFEPRLLAAIERLFSDVELRCRLSQTAARLCDGLGAERVADALIQKLG